MGLNDPLQQLPEACVGLASEELQGWIPWNPLTTGLLLFKANCYHNVYTDSFTARFRASPLLFA